MEKFEVGKVYDAIGTHGGYPLEVVKRTDKYVTFKYDDEDVFRKKIQIKYYGIGKSCEYVKINDLTVTA